MAFGFTRNYSKLVLIFALGIFIPHGSASVLNAETPGNFELAALKPANTLFPPTARSALTLTYPQLFDTSEVRSSNLLIFPKWTSLRARWGKECTSLDGSCRAKNWIAFLKTLQHTSMIQQLDAVNRYINQKPYITDNRNWNTSDYWETPMEFMEKSGDCEDFAIAKFASLRMLGVPDTAMRIVVLNDTNLRAIHAVLVVYVGSTAYILDNQIKQLVSANKIHHYQPIYSLNATTWWRHRPS